MNFKHFFTAFFMLFVFTFAGAQSYVQIGNGTESSSMPYTAWNYSWSKAIYSSDAIGNAISIQSLSFQVNGFSTALNNQKIYVKHSANATITGTYEDPETSGYTLVFDGNIVSGGEAQGEWIEIPFSGNFEYNGTDNLIVYMKNEHGSSVYNHFYATTATADEIYVQGDDDAFPTTDGLNPYPAALPNVRFNYSSDGPATPQNPAPGENAIHVDAETMLDFELGATAATYDVYFSANEADVTSMAASAKIVDAATAESAGTYSADPTPNDELLDSKSMYFWRVVVSDGTETSTSPVWSFRTQKIISSLPYHQDFEGGDDVVFTLMYDTNDSDWFWSDGLGTWNAREGSAYTGDSCAYVSPSFLDQGIEYELRTPRFNMPENAQISFFWYNGESLDAKNRVAGVDSTYFEASADGGNTWTKLASLSPTESQTAYQQVLLDLSDYAGNNTYLRWVYKILDENSYPQYVFLDNIEITQSEGNAVIQLEIADTNFDNIAIGGANEKEVVISNTGIGSSLEITGITLPDGFSS
ncbi:MAG: choice-of-anchor J domain-containing protein, partial [Salinivirgaceae bacterium]